MILLLWGALAGAAPNHAVEAAVDTSTANLVGGSLSWRSRFGNGIQLGATFRAAGVRRAYISGYPVRSGQQFGGTLDLGVPLVRTDAVQFDVEIELGARGLMAGETDGDADRAWVLVTDLRPMATLPLHEMVALRVGFTHVLHHQFGPSFGLEAQGAMPRLELVTAPTEHLQLVLVGEAGGAFGFGGDGGKFAAAGQLAVRWVPGNARTYLNH